MTKTPKAVLEAAEKYVDDTFGTVRIDEAFIAGDAYGYERGRKEERERILGFFRTQNAFVGFKDCTGKEFAEWLAKKLEEDKD